MTLYSLQPSLDSDKDFGKVVETSFSITDNSPSQGYPLALKTDLFRKFINELVFFHYCEAPRNIFIRVVRFTITPSSSSLFLTNNQTA